MRALRAGQAFDGERFIGPVDVVLDGGDIVEVSPWREHGGDVALEDLGDATVLPGLVDAHQHLSWDCSTEPLGWHQASDDGVLLETARANAERALRAGITTVRDLGARGAVGTDLRDGFAADPGTGPRILAAGPALTTPGGHCHFLGGECADGPELIAAVGRLADAGVDVIKVMATGGNVTPGSLPHEAQFGVDELQGVVEAAHRAGLPVAAHAHGTDGVVNALEAGVDTIEHCSFMTAEGIAQDPELIARLAASGTSGRADRGSASRADAASDRGENARPARSHPRPARRGRALRPRDGRGHRATQAARHPLSRPDPGGGAGRRDDPRGTGDVHLSRCRRPRHRRRGRQVGGWAPSGPARGRRAPRSRPRRTAPAGAGAPPRRRRARPRIGGTHSETAADVAPTTKPSSGLCRGSATASPSRTRWPSSACNESVPSPACDGSRGARWWRTARPAWVRAPPPGTVSGSRTATDVDHGSVQRWSK